MKSFYAFVKQLLLFCPSKNMILFKWNLNMNFLWNIPFFQEMLYTRCLPRTDSLHLQDYILLSCSLIICFFKEARIWIFHHIFDTSFFFAFKPVYSIDWLYSFEEYFFNNQASTNTTCSTQQHCAIGSFVAVSFDNVPLKNANISRLFSK